MAPSAFWFHLSLDFHMLFGLPTGWLLRNKASASVIEQRERREIETEVTQELLRSNWDCFFVLDSNPAARGIHVANVVFAGTVQPTVAPEGDTCSKKVV